MDVRTDRGGKRMAKLLIDGFRHKVGRHCESTAMRDMFEFYGHPITESMAFGLDATMGFTFWDSSSQENIFTDTYEGVVPFFIGGKQGTIRESSLACKILGIILKEESSDSPDRAWQLSKKLLENNSPLIISVDMYYLPIRDTYKKFHFGGHAISLVGYDDDFNLAYIYDTEFDNLLEIPIEELKKARGSKECGKFMSPRNTYFTMIPREDEKRPPIAAGLKLSLQKIVNNMLAASMSHQGIKGLKTFHNSISKWKDTLSSDKKISYSNESHSIAFIQFESMYGFIEEYGTGGACFRNLFLEFLLEIAMRPEVMDGSYAWKKEERRIVEDSIPIVNRSAILWSKFAHSLKGAIEEGGNDCIAHVNLEELQDTIWSIVDLEENMFKALSKIKL